MAVIVTVTPNSQTALDYRHRALSYDINFNGTTYSATLVVISPQMLGVTSVAQVEMVEFQQTNDPPLFTHSYWYDFVTSAVRIGVLSTGLELGSVAASDIIRARFIIQP